MNNLPLMLVHPTGQGDDEKGKRVQARAHTRRLSCTRRPPTFRTISSSLRFYTERGRGWRGFHHHGTLCIAAYGFLVAERNRFSPSARVGNVGLRTPSFSETFIPRGAVSARTS